MPAMMKVFYYKIKIPNISWFTVLLQKNGTLTEAKNVIALAWVIRWSNKNGND